MFFSVRIKTKMTEALSIVIDLDKETDKLVDNVDMNAVGKLMVYDENGNRHSMEDLWKDYKTIFIFVRVIRFILNEKVSSSKMLYFFYL